MSYQEPKTRGVKERHELPDGSVVFALRIQGRWNTVLHVPPTLQQGPGETYEAKNLNDCRRIIADILMEYTTDLDYRAW